MVRLIQVLRQPSGLIGCGLSLVLVAIAVTAPLIAASPNRQDYAHVLEPPSKSYWLGTDNLGRNVAARIAHGLRISLSIGALVAVASCLVGVPLGFISGLHGGAIDRVITIVGDVIMAFPTLLLAVALAAALGQSLSSAAIAISIVELPRFIRISRAEALRIRGTDFVQAAHALGVRRIRLMAKHILPNATGPIIVQLSLSISFAILAEAALGFLGLSVPPPAPSLGGMLNAGRGYLELAPWVSIGPGSFIVLAVLACNLLGDGIRDILDPRSAKVG